MKVMKLGIEARKEMKVGLDQAVNLAKVTLGGKGKIVAINKNDNRIHSTMDGVTVLQHVAMMDDTQDMGVKMVLEAAEKQVSMCGDGTTSVSILLQAIVTAGMELVEKGADSLKIRKGIEKAVEIVVQEIKDIATPVERNSKEIFDIAKVSAHGDEDVAKIVFDAISKTGKHSDIKVQVSKGVETYVEMIDGIKYPSGWLSELFVNTHRTQSAELENVHILIYEGKIYNLKEIVHFFDMVNKANHSLMIISDNLDGDALASLAVNTKRQNLKAVAVNPYGQNKEDVLARLKDLAIATGGKVLSPDEGHNLAAIQSLDDFGFAKRVSVDNKSTIIMGGNADEIELKERISVLESLADNAEGEFEEDILRGRLASLTGSVGVIHVGGTLGTEAGERKDRVDDALGAALASLENGIVPGGGVSLLMAKKKLDSLFDTNIKSGIDDEVLGMQIVSDALELPFKQIISNAGLNPEEILEGVNSRPSGTGYNVITDEYVDMISEGVLDPAKVEINIVKNSSSVATQFLNTEGSITPVINSKL